MTTQASRIRAVRQALAHPHRQALSCQDLRLLTGFVLGRVSLEDTNEHLFGSGRLPLLR